jgi:hypothetical protein
MGGPGGAAIQSTAPVGSDSDITESDSNDAWYIYSFKVLPVLQVNDKVAMKGEIRFVDRSIFGTEAVNGGTSTDSNGDTTSVASAAYRDADFKHVYMEWTSPWGKTRFGRTPAGAWGSKFINNTGQGNRLMWWLNMLPENWGSLIFTQKRAEVDATSGADVSDQDRDAYYIDLSYKADFGKTVAALWFDRRADASADLNDTITTSNLWIHGNYNWDAFNLEYELNFAFGDGLPTSDAFDSAADQEGYGIYVDGSWKMQDWTFGGLFFVLSGDDNLDDNTNKALMSASGTGIDFNPYQIITGDYMGILNPDKGAVHPAIIGNGETNAGAWSLGAYAKFAMSPQISFNAVLGYAAATDEPNGWDSAYGTELGFGMGYKIMDNLTYNAHFSYMWTGDFFTEGGTANSGIDTENVYLFAHALSMKF